MDEHADRDVLAAQRALDEPLLADIAAYHCQQTAEKYLKTALILAAVRPRKTHDLNFLADEFAVDFPQLMPLVEPLRRCTIWDFVYRYPHLDDEMEPEPATTELQTVLLQIEALRLALLKMVELAK